MATPFGKWGKNLQITAAENSGPSQMKLKMVSPFFKNPPDGTHVKPLKKWSIVETASVVLLRITHNIYIVEFTKEVFAV